MPGGDAEKLPVRAADREKPVEDGERREQLARGAVVDRERAGHRTGRPDDIAAAARDDNVRQDVRRNLAVLVKLHQREVVNQVGEGGLVAVPRRENVGAVRLEGGVPVPEV